MGSPVKAFKACHVRDDRLFSFTDVLVRRIEETAVEYKLGEWVRPKIHRSCLFTFAERYTAERFVINEGHEDEFRIFECDVEHVVKLDYIWGVTHTDVLDFWNEYEYWDTWKRIYLPEGTICGKKVKLTKHVSTIVNGVIQ